MKRLVLITLATVSCLCAMSYTTHVNEYIKYAQPIGKGKNPPQLGSKSRFCITFYYPDTAIRIGVDTIDVFKPDIYHFDTPQQAIEYFDNRDCHVTICNYGDSISGCYAGWALQDNMCDLGSIFVSSPDSQSLLRYYNSDSGVDKKYPTFITNGNIRSNFFPVANVKIGDRIADVVAALKLDTVIPSENLRRFEIYRLGDSDDPEVIINSPGVNFYESADFIFYYNHYTDDDILLTPVDTLYKIELGGGVF